MILSEINYIIKLTKLNHFIMVIKMVLKKHKNETHTSRKSVEWIQHPPKGTINKPNKYSIYLNNNRNIDILSFITIHNVLYL